MNMKKRVVLPIMLGLACIGVSAGAYLDLRHPTSPVRFDTAYVSRGDIVANVVCTGTLQAVETIQVGTQASGVIKELMVDYNSLVHKDQVVARLDDALIRAQIVQAQADLDRAQSNLQGLQVTSDEANRELARSETLHAQQLVDDSDLEDARVAAESAAADVKAAQDQVKQAQAVIDQGQVNLAHTVITSPVDGIVLARNVDVGQTVVSSMQAQTLFSIANDLGHLQLNATVDESDVGRVRNGQTVAFTVEAYPERRFTGRVVQVRVGPTIDQNVVSYVTVIDVANPDLTLRPGMTANATITVGSRADVMRVASAALRFRPFDELFTALKQPVPKAQKAVKTPSDVTERKVWIVRNGQLVPVPVRVGLADENQTEVVDGTLKIGDAVVTNAVVGQ